jgi:endo-1,4-beta-xylanase
MAILNRRAFARSAAAFGLITGASAVLADKKKPENRVPADAVPGASFEGMNSLRAHGAAFGVPVGCAAVPELLDMTGAQAGKSSDPYTRTVMAQTAILVPENAMKWSSLRPTTTTYEFGQADKLVAFAGVNGQLIRGHNLCWHEQLPKWFDATATKDNARDLLTQHIQTVAGRYAGKMHSWDVVNEAVQIADGRADGLRNSPWLQLIGPEYLELAFTAAAKADPAAKLTYNEYDIELDTPAQAAKRGQVLMLVRRLHARGVPIHAVGIQSHLQANGPMPGAGLLSFVRDAAKMGLEVYITEMDVNSHTLAGDAAAQDAAVAAVYKSYLGLLLPEPNVKAVLTWGITDAQTWLNQSRQPWAVRADGARQRPLPFDDDYAPTAAFFAMRDAIDSAVRQVAQADVMQQPQAGPEPFAPLTVPGNRQPVLRKR